MTKLEGCKEKILDSYKTRASLMTHNIELIMENEKLKEENQKLKLIAFAKETLDDSKCIGQLISEIKKTIIETEKSNVESIADFKDKNHSGESETVERVLKSAVMLDCQDTKDLNEKT